MRSQRTETSDVDRGRAALAAYVRSARLDRIDGQQDYTITDAIVSLLKLAKERGFDPRSLHQSALDHFEAEEPLVWTRQPDGYRAAWASGCAGRVFNIRRNGRKLVLTFYSRSWGAEQEEIRVGEYDSLADAKAHAQKLKEES